MNLFFTAIIIFIIAVLMTMTGRGGGNFYVLTLVLGGLTMHQAATTGQFILTISSLSATLFFGKNRNVEWKLVLALGGMTAICAFFGGFFAHYVSGKILKFIFSFFLLVASILMFRSVKEAQKNAVNKKYYLHIKTGEHDYYINLRIAIPIVIAAGFGSGMVGVSGGSFLVPLMVLACHVPIHIAVGTSTAMVGASAFMGFTGHALHGHFEAQIAIPLAIIAAVGGIIGSHFTLKTKTKRLKQLFAFTTLAASVIMIFNALLSH